MKETRTAGDDGTVAPIEDSQDIARSPKIAPKKSREPVWGAVLLACMILFVVASLAGIGWVVYTRWKSERVAQNQPSIASLLGQSVQEVVTPPDAPPAADSAQTQAPSAAESMAAAKKLEISVLNGGGAKGSAGALADFLKQEGYLKTDAGNTLKDYAGVTIYYALALEKEAGAIRESVVKKYPQAKALPADANNKETSASQVTIIVGK